MLRFLRRYGPSTLRLQLMVGIPSIATGYVLRLRGHEALVEEKRVRLQGVNALLASYLERGGGYAGLLADDRGAPDDRDAKVRCRSSAASIRRSAVSSSPRAAASGSSKRPNCSKRRTSCP